MKILTEWLARLLEAFKAKNSKLWAALFAVATMLQFGISAVLDVAIPGVEIPPEMLSLDWIIKQLNLQVNDAVTDIIMWVLVAITGSKTTADLPEPARNRKIERTGRKIARQQEKELAKGL